MSNHIQLNEQKGDKTGDLRLALSIYIYISKSETVIANDSNVRLAPHLHTTVDEDEQEMGKETSETAYIEILVLNQMYSFFAIISSTNKYRKHKSSMFIWALPIKRCQ